MKTWKPINGRTLERREDREVEYWNEYDTEGDPLIQVTPDEGSKLFINLPGLRLCEAVEVSDPLERIASALERIANVLGASSALSANAGAPRLPFEDIFS